MYQVPIDTAGAVENLLLKPGSVTLVVGPNGVGKSALLQDIYRKLPVGQASYYPGHRQITFSHGWENLGMSLTEIDTNFFAQTENFNRYKNVWPEEQFKSVLRRLQNAEAAHNQELVAKLQQGGDATVLLNLRTSPMQLLNSIFQTARLSVRLKITDLGLTAVRDNNEYQVDRLSDGERAALFIAAAIVNRRAGGVTIIDEPERHLHPSISAPLISAAVRARPNIAYVFASHDLTLIETLEVDNFVYIRNSTLIQERPERRTYDVRHVVSLDAVSPDLKRDILGVRDKVLFIEGETTSLDAPLYATCFPGWKIAPRGGHEKVQEAVRALNDNSSLHWMQVAGIVDRDGRTAQEVTALKAKSIHALKVPTVENLFFLPEVVREVAAALVAMQGGDVGSIYGAANSSIASIVSGDKDEIIARRTTWLVNRKLSESKVSVEQVRLNAGQIPRLNVQSVRRRVEGQINRFLGTGSTLADLSKLPIKNTGIPGRIASAMGLTLKRYKQIVLRQLEINSPEGQRMRAAIVKKLPSIQ